MNPSIFKINIFKHCFLKIKMNAKKSLWTVFVTFLVAVTKYLTSNFKEEELILLSFRVWLLGHIREADHMEEEVVDLSTDRKQVRTIAGRSQGKT